VQVEGITLEVLAAALAQAGDARRHILQQMARCAPPPRGELAPCAPRIVRFNIDPTRIGYMIGAGGKNIRALQAAPGIENISVRRAPCFGARALTCVLLPAPKVEVAAVCMIVPTWAYLRGILWRGCQVQLIAVTADPNRTWDACDRDWSWSRGGGGCNSPVC